MIFPASRIDCVYQSNCSTTFLSRYFDDLKSSSTGRVETPFNSLGSSPQGYTLIQCINSKNVYSSRVCFPFDVTVLSRVIR